jgi:hypothetical protein
MERNSGFHWPAPALKWGMRLSVKHRRQELRIVASLVNPETFNPRLFDMGFAPKIFCLQTQGNPEKLVGKGPYGMD